MTPARAPLALAAALLASALLAGGASGQALRDVRPFGPEEDATHAAIGRRLEEFVRAERERRWGDFYDLLYKPADWKVSRAEFLEQARERDRMQPSITVNFTPEVIGVRDNPEHTQYALFGCLEDRFQGRRRWRRGGVEAHLVDGRWYFSAVYLAVANVKKDVTPLPCTKQ